MKKRLASRLVISSAVMLWCSVVLTNNADAVEKWVVLGNTVWVSGDSRLTLEMPSVFHPDLKITSNTAADLQWIEASLPLTFDPDTSPITIKAVALCFRTPNAGTFISQTRLAEYLFPSPAFVKHDDPTDLSSAGGACYISPVADYAPAGSVNLALRLNFAAPGHEIRLGALAIRIDVP